MSQGAGRSSGASKDDSNDGQGAEHGIRQFDQDGRCEVRGTEKAGSGGASEEDEGLQDGSKTPVKTLIVYMWKSICHKFPINLLK